MPPIISIVGKSKSGKTTLIERLVSELKSRDYQVATIKHTTHITDIDKPGKDSWRHIQAGSDATAIISPQKIVLFKPTKHEASIEQIEVHRKIAGTPLGELENLIAIASDEPLQTSIRQFQLDDIADLSDIIEKEIIKPQRTTIAVYINNIPLQLDVLPREIIINTLIAMASSIKGRDKIESIDISIRRMINRDRY